MSVRLVAVLGYSTGKGRGLHDVCAVRLARAAEEATPADAVLLSGWSRRRNRASEAELMARAWNGVARHVLLDSDARSTYGNARAVARAARSLDATEVVLVTSDWHCRRSAVLVRAAVRDRGSVVRIVGTGERGSLPQRLRELACWAFVPLQAAWVGRSR
jgi:vancomycin permeability regulator SanA